MRCMTTSLFAWQLSTKHFFKHCAFFTCIIFGEASIVTLLSVTICKWSSVGLWFVTTTFHQRGKCGLFEFVLLLFHQKWLPVIKETTTILILTFEAKKTVGNQKRKTTNPCNLKVFEQNIRYWKILPGQITVWVVPLENLSKQPWTEDNPRIRYKLDKTNQLLS